MLFASNLVRTTVTTDLRGRSVSPKVETPFVGVMIALGRALTEGNTLLALTKAAKDVLEDGARCRSSSWTQGAEEQKVTSQVSDGTAGLGVDVAVENFVRSFDDNDLFECGVMPEWVLRRCVTAMGGEGQVEQLMAQSNMSFEEVVWHATAPFHNTAQTVTPPTTHENGAGLKAAELFLPSFTTDVSYKQGILPTWVVEEFVNAMGLNDEEQDQYVIMSGMSLEEIVWFASSQLRSNPPAHKDSKKAGTWAKLRKVMRRA